jgi:hypothetical protein
MDTIFLASLAEGEPDLDALKWSPPSAHQWAGGEGERAPKPVCRTGLSDMHQNRSIVTRAHAPRQVKTTLINYTKTRQLLRNEIEVTPVSTPGSDDVPCLLAISKFSTMDKSELAVLVVPEEALVMTATDDVADGGGASDAVAAVETAITHFAAGGMVLVADDLDRENEGDLIVAAEKITREQVLIIIGAIIYGDLV